MSKLKLFDTPVEDGSDPFPPMGESLTGESRAEARLCAIQATYQHLLMDDSFAQIGERFLREELSKRDADKELFQILLTEVNTGKERFIEMISGHLGENWSYERLALIERSLLLVAIAEMYAKPETSNAVIIDQFINLAKGFVEDKKCGFVNGLLDNIAKKVRA